MGAYQVYNQYGAFMVSKVTFKGARLLADKYSGYVVKANRIIYNKTGRVLTGIKVA